MADWIKATERLPEPEQYIEAEIREAGVLSKVWGKYAGNGHVMFDFWSGTAGALIIRWKPRMPSGTPGHPWTSIARGTDGSTVADPIDSDPKTGTQTPIPLQSQEPD